MPPFFIEIKIDERAAQHKALPINCHRYALTAYRYAGMRVAKGDLKNSVALNCKWHSCI